MGYALAKAAVNRGWEVDLVSGPVALAPPDKVELHSIETAEQLRDALVGLFTRCDLLLMAAAVSDFRPARRLEHKEKKLEADRTLDLVPTPDLLWELGRQKGDRVLVGFAAETDNLEENGRKKLQEKKLDWIAINRVGPGIGFQSDENEILLLGANGSRQTLGPAPKSDIANDLLEVLKLDSNSNVLST
jgi:phosphopantothenoylcysteine decarboxylase/phosphopantothenate--cysteine ligase|tara:strand:+ start:1291 stop:1857 length:567 start_codon:yes stop_codon:yes gene_type:complete